VNSILSTFYTYRISSRMYFHLPIIFIYFYLADMGLLQVEILLAVYGATLSLTSGISPMLVRSMRYKNVLALGEFLKALGLLIIVIKLNFWVAVIGQIITALGYSLGAGTDSSLLRSYTSTNQITSEQYNRTESNTQSWMFISTLVSGIIGSLLFNVDHIIPFYASMACNLIALAAILFIPEEKTVKSAASSNTQSAPQEKLVLTRGQKFWINYYAMTRGFALATFVGFLPYLFFKLLAVDMKVFGLVLSMFSISAFFSARYILKAAKSFAVSKLALTSMILLTICMLLFGISDQIWVGLIAITLMGIANGGVRPLTMNNLNSGDVSPQIRTRLIKTVEQRYGVWNAVLLLAGGYVLDSYGFQSLLIGLTIAYALLLVINFSSNAKGIGQRDDQSASM
jgi:predicted MFS family arabinose efflux permease